MRLVILGPPGAGKGTQANRLSQQYQIPHISTGDILREAVRSKSELGVKVNSYLVAGELVPDDLMLELIRRRLSNMDNELKFILDGFPRTVVQAQGLDNLLVSFNKNLTAVISIELDSEEIVRRLSSRRVCSSCGKIYNLLSSPPQKPGICDICGGKLIQREDDKESTVLNRLKVYTQQTAPLKEFYKAKGLLRQVDGQGSVEQVFTRIVKVLNRKGPQ